MSDIKECFSARLDTLVRDHAQDQWSNYRRALTTPQAREELLGGARVYCYAAGTTEPLTVYADTSRGIYALPMPFILHSDGRCAASVMFPTVPIKLTVVSPWGENIATVDNVRY